MSTSIALSIGVELPSLVVSADKVEHSIRVPQALCNLVWSPEVPFLYGDFKISLGSENLASERTIGTTWPRSPITFRCLLVSSSRYGTITCVPAFAICTDIPNEPLHHAKLDLEHAPSFATIYRPRKPVLPNTVATRPVTALLPGGPYEITGLLGRVSKSWIARCSRGIGMHRR